MDGQQISHTMKLISTLSYTILLHCYNVTVKQKTHTYTVLRIQHFLSYIV